MATSLLITILIVCLAASFGIRGRWIGYKTEEHQLKTVWYCWRTKQKESVLLELLALWPSGTMLFEFWCWNFDRYIIHRDRLEEMKEFIDHELLREDIDLEMLQQAQEQFFDKNKENNS